MEGGLSKGKGSCGTLCAFLRLRCEYSRCKYDCERQNNRASKMVGLGCLVDDGCSGRFHYFGVALFNANREYIIEVTVFSLVAWFVDNK